MNKQREQSQILCSYYGLQTKRLSVKSIAVKHALTESRILKIVRESERKLQFLRPVGSKRAELERSDEAIFLISTCLGIGEQPMTVIPGELEIELQPPCVATSPKDGSIDPATTCKCGMIAIDLDVHLLMFG